LKQVNLTTKTYNREKLNMPVSPKSTQKISRKQQILECLALMLQSSPGQRITTAKLAAEVGVSEAA
jgi:TetR/AcrR family transcriptional regulator